MLQFSGTLTSILSHSDLVRGRAEGANRPVRQSGGAAKMGVKFNKLEFLILFSYGLNSDFCFQRKGSVVNSLALSAPMYAYRGTRNLTTFLGRPNCSPPLAPIAHARPLLYHVDK